MLVWALAIGLVSVFVPGAAALTDSSPPAPPTALVAERVDAETVRVAWVPPADEGGSEIEAYHVYRAEDPTGEFTLVGSTENTTFEDPDARVEMGPFWYTVTAENDHGQSAQMTPTRETEEMSCIRISLDHFPPFHIDTGQCPDEDDIRQELEDILEDLLSRFADSPIYILCHSWPGQVRTPVDC